MSEPSWGWRDWSHLPAVTDKQRFVLELRYGLKDGVEYSYEDIAELMGVGREHVYRLEQRGLERIRRGLNLELGNK